MATGNLATRTTDAQSIFAVPPRPAAIRAIAATGGFSGLDGIAATVLVQRGQTLFFEGDPARSCFRVVTGAVRSSRLLADGRRQVGDFFLPDDFFGFGINHVAGYVRADLGGWYAINSRVTAYANVENALDRRYNEVVGYPALPLNFRAGFRFRLGGE